MQGIEIGFVHLVGHEPDAHGIAGVDDVLVVVAGIVPTAGRGDDCSLGTGVSSRRGMHKHVVIGMTGRAGIAFGIGFFGSHGCPLVVIGTEGSAGQLAIGTLRNGEPLPNPPHKGGRYIKRICARGGKVGEIDQLTGFAGDGIEHRRGCGALPDGVLVFIEDENKGRWSLVVGRLLQAIQCDGGGFLLQGAKADLIDGNHRRRVVLAPYQEGTSTYKQEI